MSIAVKKIISTFPVRRMDYEFNNTSRYWIDNDAGLTHYFTALSLLFPEGEKFFVDSVRAVRHLLKDNPQLDKEISAFIGQEAMHSKEHHAFHENAKRHGLNPESLEKRTGYYLNKLIGFKNPKHNLAITVGLEHFTAVMVVRMMETINELMTDKTIQHLWLWHSIEETEHKAVAFDLFEALYGKGLDAYLTRTAIFTMAFTLILTIQTEFMIRLMYRDGKLFKFGTWKKVLQLYKRELPSMMPKFLDFYRPNFHPNDSDEAELILITKEKLGLLT